MIAEVLKSPDKEWDRALEKFEYATIFQTSAYAQYLNKATGVMPLYARVVSQHDTEAMCLLFLSPRLFSTRLDPRFSLPLRKILTLVTPCYSSFYGPVSRNLDNNSLGLLFHELRSTALGRRAKIVLTPPPLANDLNRFGSFGRVTKRLMTNIIDLRKDFEILRREMSTHSAMKNAERAMRRGVDITDVRNLEEFSMYRSLLNLSRKSLGIRSYYGREVKPVFELIKGRMMHCLIAMQQNRPLAGILVSNFNGYLNEWGAAQAPADKAEHFYANDLLRYYIVKWGHDNGYRYYDQSGVSLLSRKDLGIFKYKTKWGGAVVEYNSYEIS